MTKTRIYVALIEHSAVHELADFSEFKECTVPLDDWEQQKSYLSSATSLDDLISKVLMIKTEQIYEICNNNTGDQNRTGGNKERLLQVSEVQEPVIY